MRGSLAAPRPRGCGGVPHQVQDESRCQAAYGGAHLSSVACDISTSSVRVSSGRRAACRRGRRGRSWPTSGEKRRRQGSSAGRRPVVRGAPSLARPGPLVGGVPAPGGGLGSPATPRSPAPRRSGSASGSSDGSAPNTATYSSVTTCSGVRSQPSCSRMRPDSDAFAAASPTCQSSVVVPRRRLSSTRAGRCRSRRAPTTRSHVGVVAGAADQGHPGPAMPGRGRWCAARRSAARPPRSGSPWRSGRCGRTAHAGRSTASKGFIAATRANPAPRATAQQRGTVEPTSR